MSARMQSSSTGLRDVHLDAIKDVSSAASIDADCPLHKQMSKKRRNESTDRPK